MSNQTQAVESSWGDIEYRVQRLRGAMRGLAALAYSESAPEEALMGKRCDLSDLLDILGDEVEAATAPLLGEVPVPAQQLANVLHHPSMAAS